MGIEDIQDLHDGRGAPLEVSQRDAPAFLVQVDDVTEPGEPGGQQERGEREILLLSAAGEPDAAECQAGDSRLRGVGGAAAGAAGGGGGAAGHAGCPDRERRA